jgi:thioredoxin reductase
LDGPEYARRLVGRAGEAGATIRTSAMVTGWDPAGRAEVTAPSGRILVEPRAVVIATGARERPRSARMIPGDRPAGVFTTGQLQNHVHRSRGLPGRRAVVVGAELVSWSAVLTLRAAGCRTVLMTSELSRTEAGAVIGLAGRIGLRTPLAPRTRVVRLIGPNRPDPPGIGTSRLRAVEIEHLATGVRSMIACDTVVFTGDWIPDHELVRTAGLDLDPASLGPVVDGSGRTSRPGFFAAGNLLHPVETADVAALGGRHVAGAVRAWLDGIEPPKAGLRLLAEPPFRWVSPGLLRAGDPAPARNRLLLRSERLVRLPEVTVRQDGREIGRRRLPWSASPSRLFRVPAGVLDQVDHGGGDVTIGLL